MTDCICVTFTMTAGGLTCVQLQGIRRIVAVTGQEAAEAIKEGEALADQLAAAQKLQGQDLEKEVAALKQVRGHENLVL